MKSNASLNLLVLWVMAVVAWVTLRLLRVGGYPLQIVGRAAGLFYILFCLCMVFHVITNIRLGILFKIFWVLAIGLLPGLGPVLYYFFGRRTD
jgi:hypothetical protein